MFVCLTIRKQDNQMMKRIVLLINILLCQGLIAQRGKNGNVTITSANQVINAYTTLTANAPAGSISIQVANSALNSNFSQPLSPGDLIFIIQMQGATIKASIDPWNNNFSDPKDSSWGEILQYNNCGNHEFIEVAAVPNNTTIVLNCPLTYSYDANGKVQVIRVPRYNNFTVNSGASVTAPAWNGSTGGVVVAEVSGNTTINGQINVNGLGFRGGTAEQQSYLGGGQWGSSDPGEGAMKGESIAGWQTEYALFSGIYGKGAPANGGGGGNCHNGGGGGGANAGNINNWNGKGNPDISNANYIQAWNLETPPMASNTSSGGGRGGYTFSNSNQNELTVPPGNTAWGGDYRRVQGGLGGRPLDYSTGKIFMGGGGGAGDANNPYGGNGGNGGGIVYIVSYGNITGTGSINANGSNGGNSQGTGNPFSTTGNDGAGGGGGGGTILLKTTGTVSGITLNANGGNGGNQILTGFSPSEAEGPGGGGGGGYIALSNGTPVQNVNGGLNGTTNSPHITNFPPNGATRGGAGLANQPLPTVSLTASNDTAICAGDSVFLYAYVSGSFSGTINWYDAPFGGNIIGTGNSYLVSSLMSKDTFWVGLCPGQYRLRIIVDTLYCAPPVADFASSDTILCPGDCISFVDLSSNATAWSWYFPGATPSTSNLQNPSGICYNSPGFYDVTLIVTNAFQSDTITKTAFIQVDSCLSPTASFTASDSVICAGSCINFINNSTNGVNYYWYFPGATTPTSNQFAPSSVCYNMPGNYDVTLVVTNAYGQDSVTKTQWIQVLAIPQADAGKDTSICIGDTIQLTANGGSSYTWYPNNNIINSNTATPQIFPSASQYYWVVASNGTCSDTDSVFVQVYNYPNVTITGKTSVCQGDTTHLFASGSSNYIWSTGNCNGDSCIFTVNNTTSYFVIGYNGHCSDTAVFTLVALPKPALNICCSTQIQEGDSVVLTVSGATTYNWTPAGYCFNPACDSIKFYPQQSGQYCVMGTNNNGCSDSACVYIQVEKLCGEVFIPNVFSPNGDGIHDKISVYGNCINNLQWIIFNRWGEKVFESNSINQYWDGTFRSMPAPQGVYFYWLKYTGADNLPHEQKGTITLTR